MSCCTPTCQKWSVFSIAGCLMILSVVLLICWDGFYNRIKSNELSLANDGTKEYELWQETPIPMYIGFYLYNWTNHQEVVDSKWKIKPIFVELGPYTYSEHHIRKDVVFNKDNGTITYKTQRVWHFIPEKSKGSLQDEITTVNVILATIGSIIKYKHPIVKIGVNFFLEEKGVKLTVTKTAREFLFDGYDDPMLQLLHKLNISEFNVPFDKFGWFYMRNNSATYDGTFNMLDGSDSLRNLGRIVEWNFANKTDIYPSYCGMVNGTSGELWYPIADDESVDVFSSDTCSTLSLVRNGTAERFGLQGHKFVGDARVFDNGTTHPEMACFSAEEIVPSGVRNVSKCKFNAPAFISYPHFYLADPCYRNAIEGMRPNRTEHEFSIGLEPETGIPLYVQAVMQINIRLETISRIKLLEGIPEIYLPTLWFKQYAELTEDLASEAKLLLILPQIGHYTGWGMLGIGVLLFVVGIFITVRREWRGREDEEPLRNADDT